MEQVLTGQARPELVARLIVHAIKAHAYLFIFAGLYGLSAMLLIQAGTPVSHQDFGAFSRSFLEQTVPIQLGMLLLLRCAKMVCERPRRPALFLLADLKNLLFDPRRLLNGLPVAIALTVFLATFAFYKMNIPNLVPFVWDTTFTNLDERIHFGSHPWEWLQPVLGYPLVTQFLDTCYSFWFFVISTMWFAFAFVLRPSVLRTRFFLSFMLIWALGGTFMAIVFSSAGPAFYERIGLDPAPYEGLLTYLAQVSAVHPLFSFEGQKLLWSGYLGEQSVFTGISAMPSMHNATMMLFSLAAWRVDRRLGWGLIAFQVVIFLGSVHLGWHYAIDAYVGYLLAAVLWIVTKPIAEWHERQSWSVAYVRLLKTSARVFIPATEEDAPAAPGAAVAQTL